MYIKHLKQIIYKLNMNFRLKIQSFKDRLSIINKIIQTCHSPLHLIILVQIEQEISNIIEMLCYADKSVFFTEIIKFKILIVEKRITQLSDKMRDKTLAETGRQMIKGI